MTHYGSYETVESSVSVLHSLILFARSSMTCVPDPDLVTERQLRRTEGFIKSSGLTTAAQKQPLRYSKMLFTINIRTRQHDCACCCVSPNITFGTKQGMPCKHANHHTTKIF
jgi:hypothetical protein